MDLDLKDKKLLTEIEMNARISHTSLAKKVGLSKHVVKYRIEKLEEENIIQGYNAIIDSNKLGETIYVIYLKLIKISSTQEKRWMEEIGKNPAVITVGKNAGFWDLTLVIKSKDNQELNQLLEKILENKLENIKEKKITSEIESSYFNLKLIHESKNIEFSTSNKQDKIAIDEIDKKILNFLANNCRIGLVDISIKLKMSPNGVKDRIKKLEKNKIIIGYKTKINYEELGYLHYRVFLHFRKMNDDIYIKIRQFLRNKQNVESVSTYIGYADIDFRCYSKNLVGFYLLISEIKDNFLQNIIEIDSMPIFSWEKIEYYK